ncbi:MAG: hypothetical protein SNI45_02400 [Rikenellaceae bacterium]
MKKTLLTGAALCFALSLSAQASLPTPEVVTNDYDRNSISIVVVDRGDKLDDMVTKAVFGINTGEKFDKNTIPTCHFMVDSVRKSKVAPQAVASCMNGSHIGNEIVKFWFTVDNSGMMTGSKVESRGLYNADDQDVENANASQIGEAALMDAGYDLINNSYVIVMDCSNFEEGVTEKKQLKEGSLTEMETIKVPNISATSTLMVYKIDFSEDQTNEFYDKCWIDSDTPESEIAARKAAFEAMSIPMVPVSTATSTKKVEYEKMGDKDQKDAALRKAIEGSYFGCIYTLEKNIEAWKVKVPVYDVKPIRAKVGTKEGLKNTARYMAYETVRKKDAEGNSVDVSVKRGYVRATKVANNSSVADGQSPMSEFYQISHVANIKPNQTLKQANDLAMGITAAYSTNPMAPINVTIDYLMNMKTNGTSTYSIVDISYKSLSADELSDNGISTTGIYSEGISFIGAGVGAGIGLRAGRSLEIVPNVIVGGDYMQATSQLDTEESDEAMMDKIAWYGKVGAKVNITVAYPLQIVAGIDYSMIVSEGAWYEYNNSVLTECGIGREGGLGISIGLKYIF